MLEEPALMTRMVSAMGTSVLARQSLQAKCHRSCQERRRVSLRKDCSCWAVTGRTRSRMSRNGGPLPHAACAVARTMHKALAVDLPPRALGVLRPPGVPITNSIIVRLVVALRPLDVGH